MKSKVCVIGLDGATFDLLMPWIKDNKLPNLKKIIKTGSYGDLETTFPPITPAAWTSFMTGQNPGRHGVMDFLYRQKGSYDLLPYSSSMLKSKTLWELLGEYGKKVCIVNVPMTYPPKKVNGYLITGIETPRIKELIKTNCTYPKSLVKKLIQKVPGYQMMPRNVYRKGFENERIKEIYQVLQKREKAVQWLLKEDNWDLFTVVFSGTDVIQHDFWHILDKSHPKYSKKEAKIHYPKVLKFFQKVDRVVGKIVANRKFSHYILLSDHGFGTVKKWIYLNCWLRKKGYLRLKRNPVALMKSLLFDIGFTPENVYRLLSMIGFSKAKYGQGKRAKMIDKFFLGVNDIDWTRTKVYAMGHVGQLFINLKGREPQGIVKKGREYEELRAKLKKDLMKFKDPENNKNVVEKVYYKEDLYKGPHFKEIADVLFMPNKLEYWTLGVSSFISNKIIGPAFGNTGNHRMNGIFTINGKNVKKDNLLKNTKITDIFPTILNLFDIPIPKDVDGNLISKAFIGTRNEKKSSSKLQKPESDSKQHNYSKEEEEEIRKRLQDLGYLS